MNYGGAEEGAMLGVGIDGDSENVFANDRI